MKSKSAFKAFKNQSTGDILFDIFNHAVLILLTLSILYPLYFIIIASFSDPVAINNGRVFYKPVGFNILGYQRIFENTKIWIAYGITIFYTTVVTLINVTLTMMIAYPLSR